MRHIDDFVGKVQGLDPQVKRKAPVKHIDGIVSKIQRAGYEMRRKKFLKRIKFAGIIT